MSEFKFNCPACGQHLLVDEAWTGRRIDCPMCSARIVIPAPLKPDRQDAAKPQSSPPVRPKLSGSAEPGSAPARTTPSEAPPAASTAALPKAAARKAVPAAPEVKPAAPASAPASPEHLHIAVLTPAVKLDLVRAVRKRIATESAWIPGRINGVNAYAAKVVNGQNVLVDPRAPEATRFSLIGAFLVEMRLREVVRTATGRTEFLDHEIPDAVREVLFAELGDEAHNGHDDPLAGRDLMAASHPQSLAALDVMEARYSRRMEQARIERAQRHLDPTRLPDLVRKLEKKGRIQPEEVATALFHELMEVRRRLERLEHRANESKGTSAAVTLE